MITGGKNREEAFYDILEDLELIEASFAMQYGIRLRRCDMSYGEFLALLKHLLPESPLGRVIKERKNKKPLFTEEEFKNICRKNFGKERKYGGNRSYPNRYRK